MMFKTFGITRLTFLLILFVFSSECSFSQTDIYYSTDKRKYCIIDFDTIRVRPKLSIGTSHCGLGFGNFRKYYGIRFSALDYDSLNNGISFNLFTRIPQYKKTNGAQVSLLFSNLSKVNGISLSTLGSSIDNGNGLVVSGILNDGLIMNGIQLTGLLSMTYDINGCCISGIANITSEQKGLLFAGLINIVDSISYGINISGIFQKIEGFKGICFSAVNVSKNGKGVQIGLVNKAAEMTGMQLGLINIIEEKTHLKCLPFFNCSFK